MRQRTLVGVKLTETLCRGLFVLACTYQLPLVEAGRFGLTATLVGLLAFAIGFERQIDVQRQMAGLSPAAIRRRFGDTLRFFGCQYLLLLPLGAAVLWAAGNHEPLTLVALVAVVVGEHLSNQAYQALLIDRSAFGLMLAAAVKSFCLLLAVLLGARLAGPDFDARWVLHAWALASLAYAVVAAWLWRRGRRVPQDAALPAPQGILQQYRASRLHFLVGLVAVGALQVDRLVVGGALNPSDLGVYFRNIALAGLALQLFNIVSYNRVAPGVFGLARNGAHDRARQVVETEYRRFALVLAVGLGLALAANAGLGHPARRLGLENGYLVLLAIGVLLRAAADYAGLLLLSVGADGKLFRNQSLAVLGGGTCLLVLAPLFGLVGAFAGALATHLAYLLLNRLSWKARSVATADRLAV